MFDPPKMIADMIVPDWPVRPPADVIPGDYPVRTLADIGAEIGFKSRAAVSTWCGGHWWIGRDEQGVYWSMHSSPTGPGVAIEMRDHIADVQRRTGSLGGQATARNRKLTMVNGGTN